jgi:FkbM family methyltransferase
MLAFLLRHVHFLRKFPGVKTAARLAFHRFSEGSVTRIRTGEAKGLLWKRYHRQTNAYWLGHYEPANQAAMRRYIKPGARVFDVGAAAGFFSLVAANLAGPDGSCVAFEPDPFNLRTLEEKFRINGLDRWKAVGSAVGEKQGTIKFCYSGEGSTVGHVGKKMAGEKTLQVPLTTLDAAAKRYGKPDFIKMDVEWAEVQALKGSGRLLKKVRPVWLIEVHDRVCGEGVKRILNKFLYRILTVEDRPVEPSADLPHHILAVPF